MANTANVKQINEVQLTVQRSTKQLILVGNPLKIDNIFFITMFVNTTVNGNLFLKIERSTYNLNINTGSE